MASYGYNYGYDNQPIILDTYQSFQPDCGQVGRPHTYPHISRALSANPVYPYPLNAVHTPVIGNPNIVNYNGVPYTQGLSMYRGPVSYAYNGYQPTSCGIGGPVHAGIGAPLHGGYPIISPCEGPRREIYPGPQCSGVGPIPVIEHHNIRGPVAGSCVNPRLRRRNTRYPRYNNAVAYPTTHSIPGPYLQSYINLPNRTYPY